MRSSSRVGRLAALLVPLLLWAPAAGAQDKVALDLTLVLVSDKPGGVAGDGRAKRADEILGKELRYESLEVVDTSKRTLSLNEIWSVRLPTKRYFRVRPMDVGDNGVLLSVDLEGVTQGDFRVRKGKPLVFGGQSHEGGKLVVIVEPDY